MTDIRQRYRSKSSVKTLTPNNPRGSTMYYYDERPREDDNSTTNLPSVPINDMSGSVTEVSDQSSKPNDHEARTRQTLDDWNFVRQQMLDARIYSETPASFNCVKCLAELDNPIRCSDCGIGVYCPDCEKSVHSNILHKPEIWKV